MSQRLSTVTASPNAVDGDLRASEPDEHDERITDERPWLTSQMVEGLDGPASSHDDVAWAEEMADQVAALWEGRPGAVPFEMALTTAARGRRR
jgi:hypothetical protein